MEQNRVLKFIFAIAACLSLAFIVSSGGSSDEKKTCCTDRFGLNYTLPMFFECQKKGHPNGSMVQTIPKIIPHPFEMEGCTRRERGLLGTPPGRRVCRFPDCGVKPCENGWCEETMTGHLCHCSTGFQGKYCNEPYTLDTNTSQPELNRVIIVACVDNINVTVELGTPNKSVEFTAPSAVSTDGANLLGTFNYRSGDVFPVGLTEVVYTFAVESGTQESSCTFNINVRTIDTTPPVVTSCPSNQIYPVLTNAIQIFWTPPTAANYQPGDIVVANSFIEVFYVVADNSGLVNTNCSFNITLVSVESEWTCTSSKCYRGYTFQPWQEAHDFCLSLRPISTATGDKTPSLLFEDKLDEHIRHLGHYVWINLNDVQAEGHYVDGTGAVPNTTSWLRGSPNGGSLENCVAVTLKGWADFQCDFEILTICQILL